MTSTPSHTPQTYSQDDHGLAGMIDENEIKAWAPIVGGGGLVAYGLTRRSLGGLLLASIGGFLLYRGLVPQPLMMHTGGVVTINRKPDELYQFWRSFENLPTIMENLVSVETLDATHSHWTAKSAAGRTIEWDAEIVTDEPDQRIAWRSVKESEIATNGQVRFTPAHGNRGTEVHLTLEYTLPAGMVGAAAAAVLGVEPSQQARNDLRRFKQYMETGEVSTTTGQPAGPRGHAPAPETTAGLINNLLEGVNIFRTGGRSTRSRAGTRV